MTALMVASIVGDVRVVLALLASKADVNAIGDNGLSALQLAATAGNLGVAKLLMQAGARF